MLNLTSGKCYHIETSYGGIYRGKIISKTVHGEKCHSYLIVWPAESKQLQVGIHVWDYGVANSGTTICFTNMVIKCREIRDLNEVSNGDTVQTEPQMSVSNC